MPGRYPVAGLDREPLFLDMARRVQALNHTTYELHQGSTDELEGLDFDVLTVNQLFYNQERLGDVLDLLDRLPAGKVALLSSDPSWPNDYKGFVKLRKLLGSEATHWSPYIMQVIT